MAQPQHASSLTPVLARQSLMRLCAEATEAELRHALALLEPLPHVLDARPISTGLVMLRGRMGGDGAPFNLGEATVSRATVTLDGAQTGFSYILGRSHAKARLAAIMDALGQMQDWSPRVQEAFIVPVTARIEAERTTQRAQTEATRVNFFTLARGED